MIKSLILPKWNDARWLLLLLLLCYAGYAISSPAFTRTPAQFAASLLTCLGLDIALLAWKRVPLLPLSGLISVFGVFLLTDSPTVWAYVLVGALTILSKHFITSGGRHIFNPNNFGVVLAILLFPSDITTEAGRWGGATAVSVFVATFGFFVVYRAHRFALTASYVGWFFAGAVIRAFIAGKPIIMAAAPMTGAAFQLFVFYMISDPRTTPKTRRGQLAFGFSLALIDNVFRYSQLKNAPFFSLFLLTALYALVRRVEPRAWLQAPEKAA
jgi:Na+-translocating ferredoxin:NAD+ oxidoreductase RnfD subunit